MRPLKRLNVRGMRTCGLTSIKTPLDVWIYTWRRPALLSGESRSVSRHWCVMSGRASAMSRPIFASTFWWSSQFRRAYFSPASLLPRACVALPLDTLYVSRHACSSTTMSRGVDSFSAVVLGTLGAVGTMVGPARERFVDVGAIVAGLGGSPWRSTEAGV